MVTLLTLPWCLVRRLRCWNEGTFWNENWKKTTFIYIYQRTHNQSITTYFDLKIKMFQVIPLQLEFHKLTITSDIVLWILSRSYFLIALPRGGTGNIRRCSNRSSATIVSVTNYRSSDSDREISRLEGKIGWYQLKSTCILYITKIIACIRKTVTGPGSELGFLLEGYDLFCSLFFSTALTSLLAESR